MSLLSQLLAACVEVQVGARTTKNCLAEMQEGNSSKSWAPKKSWALGSFGRRTVPEEVGKQAQRSWPKHTVNAWTRPSGAPLVPDAFGQYQSQALSCCSKRESQSWMLAFTVLRGLYCSSELDHRSAWKCVCTLRSVCCPLHVNIMAWHCEHNNCDISPLASVVLSRLSLTHLCCGSVLKP